MEGNGSIRSMRDFIHRQLKAQFMEVSLGGGILEFYWASNDALDRPTADPVRTRPNSPSSPCPDEATKVHPKIGSDAAHWLLLDRRKPRTDS